MLINLRRTHGRGCRRRDHCCERSKREGRAFTSCLHPFAGRATKRYLNESFSLGFEDSFALYMKLQGEVFAGADFAEAKAAFAAKRDPVWK